MRYLMLVVVFCTTSTAAAQQFVVPKRFPSAVRPRTEAALTIPSAPARISGIEVEMPPKYVDRYVEELDAKPLLPEGVWPDPEDLQAFREESAAPLSKLHRSVQLTLIDTVISVYGRNPATKEVFVKMELSNEAKILAVLTCSEAVFEELFLENGKETRHNVTMFQVRKALPRGGSVVRYGVMCVRTHIQPGDNEPVFPGAPVPEKTIPKEKIAAESGTKKS